MKHEPITDVLRSEGPLDASEIAERIGIGLTAALMELRVLRKEGKIRFVETGAFKAYEVVE